MSDSVKKWFEMQEEIKTSLQADKEMASAGIGQENKKAYRILIDLSLIHISEPTRPY